MAEIITVTVVTGAGLSVFIAHYKTEIVNTFKKK